MLRTSALIACVLAVTGWSLLVTTARAAETTPAAHSTAAHATHTITMAAMEFGPVPADVHVGDTIVWVNNDVLEHTATAKDGSFDVDLKPGAKASITVKKAGSFPFVCKFHPNMVGTLVVK
ncbi:MAG: cupredoxin domain-containing protein [Rhodanobacter sp.]